MVAKRKILSSNTPDTIDDTEPGVPVDHATQKVVTHTKNIINSGFDPEFWYHTGSEENPKINISATDLCTYLNNQGNWLYGKTDEKEYEFINVQNKIVDQTNEFVMKKKTLDSLSKFDDLNGVYSKLHGGSKTHFGTHILEGLPFYRDAQFMTDDINHCYHFYRNCFVKITSQGVETLTYAGLPGHIWRHQLIDRDYYPVDDYMTCDYARFITIAATGRPDTEAHEFDDTDFQRILSMSTGAGYLIHGYKNPSTPKIVVGIDSKMSYDNEPNGRSGKNLYFQGPANIVNTHYIDGKTFKTNTEHPFSGMKPGVRVINFSDIRKNFDMQFFFNMATDGMSINEKHMKTVNLAPKESPKLYVSMNHIPKGESDSYIARQFIIEFGDYFSAQRQPWHVFKRNMFDTEWDAAEWNRFDNFMMFCAAQFLSVGLVPFPQVNLATKKVLDALPEEVLDYFNNGRYLLSTYAASGVEPVIHEYDKDIEFKLFQEAVPEHAAIKKNQFTSYLKAWASYKNWIINPHKEKQGYRDMRNGKDYIKFFLKNKN